MVLNAVVSLLIANAAPGAVPPQLLGAEIVRVAKVYNIDALLLTRIVIVESKGIPTAHNKRTGDYGLTQLSPATAASYHISKRCLKDWRCNLRRGAQVLHDMHRSSHYRPCVYNVGATGLRRKPTACLAYELKLANL